MVGANAIDLVKQVHGCETAGEAVAWVEARQGEVAAHRMVITGCNLSEFSASVKPARLAARDPQNGMRLARQKRACQQVARRQPRSWESVVRIFQDMRFELTRTWNPGGFIYTIFDSLFNIPSSRFDPHGVQVATGQKDLLLSGAFKELERAEVEARFKRDQQAARERNAANSRSR